MGCNRYGPPHWTKICPQTRVGEACKRRAAFVPAVTVCQQNLYTFVKVRKLARPVWDITGNITFTRNVKWNNDISVSTSRQTSWSEDWAATKSGAVSWNTQKLTSTTDTGSWNTQKAIAKSGSVSWNTDLNVSQGRSSSWNTGLSVARTDSSSWNDRYKANKGANVSWNVAVGAVTMTSIPVGVPSGQATNVYVKDLTNSIVLYDVNASTPINYPASCTKMMTVLLCIEYHRSDFTTGTVTLNSADTTNPYPGFSLSTAGFNAGDVITWEGLCYGAVLPSGFDACQAIARAIGDELYAAAGNTGTSGMTRFIERMNARAVEFGFTDCTYFDPFGGSQSGATIRNVLSAKLLGRVFEETMKYSEIRTICGTIQHGVVITGPNARTQTLTNVVSFINGPTLNPSLIKDPAVIAAKTGDWNSDQSWHNIVMLWQAPAGQEILISTVGSITDYARTLDVRGIMNMLPIHFPYLGVADSGTDSAFSNVKILVGADGSVVDEGPVGRSLTFSGTIGDPIAFGSTGSALFTNIANGITAADSPDLQVGSSDMTVELWFAANGSPPGAVASNEYIFFGKLGNGTQREWTINAFGGTLNLFVSGDGNNWGSTTLINFGSATGTFFNGAPHHLALVKSGGTWAAYLDGERFPAQITGVPSAVDTTSAVTVGMPISSLAPLGRVDEFRFTIGTARYTANMVSILNRKFPRS